MFGYIRPDREKLSQNEYAYYRSIYCGICKSIGRQYGQIPRLGITYDMAFYALFLLALDQKEGEIIATNCIAHPFSERPVMQEHNILDLAADLTVILAYYKGKDDIADAKRVQGFVITSAYARAVRKAGSKHASIVQYVKAKLQELARVEAQEFTLPKQAGDIPLPAKVFGEIMGELLVYPVRRQFVDYTNQKYDLTKALFAFGKFLGAWVYLCDAIDDLAKDMRKKEANYYSDVVAQLAEGDTLPIDAYSIADYDLQQLEQQLDRIAALLPYRINGYIVQNFICSGLPKMRRKVLAKAQKYRGGI